jgi:hypothetical protein
VNKVNLRVNGVLYGCVLDSMLYGGETKCVLCSREDLFWVVCYFFILLKIYYVLWLFLFRMHSL